MIQVSSRTAVAAILSITALSYAGYRVFAPDPPAVIDQSNEEPGRRRLVTPPNPLRPARPAPATNPTVHEGRKPLLEPAEIETKPRHKPRPDGGRIGKKRDVRGC